MAENFLSLSALQAVNYLLPLITLPYLVRVLGPEKFGLIAFAQAFIQYFNILTDYGFNLSATREISIHRDNKEKISEIFSSVMITKIGLMIISFLILSVLVFTIPKFRNDWLIYFFTFGMVIGQILFPVWFFQGMERMKYITILNIVAKGIFTICIFIFIRKMADYLYVPLINSMGFLVAGGLSLRIVSKDFGIKFILPSFKAIKHQLKEGWHIFISTAAISLYTNTRIFAVGLFTNNTITGYYAIAEKLINVIQTFPLSSLLQTLYPRLSKIYLENKEKAKKLMDRFQNLTIVIYLLVLPLIFVATPPIVKIVTGAPYKEVIVSFRLLLIAVFFINANAFRVQFLLVMGKYNIFARIHLIMGIIGLLLTFLATYFFSYIGTATSIIVVEFVILVLTIKYYK
ncbi:MAG: flippase [Thermosipho sp. (in: Bacteria)]|nr:flippase [Thermosipho sp. (in: thermotogales)]